ncbi:MAG: CdaR family protein [Armatimonadetes bacterium]|nr:CdaR family protein [Armatimonadota bacterium]
MILRSFRENLALKMIAVAAAVLLWFYVSSERDPHTTRQAFATIKTVGSAPHDLLVQVSTNPVPVTLTGPRSELYNAIGEGDVKAIVNISQISANTTLIPIKQYQLPRSAPNVTVIGVKEVIPVTISLVEHRRMGVTVSYQNSPPFGKTFSVPIVQPTIAELNGPGDTLNKVARLIVYADTGAGAVNSNLPIIPVDRNNRQINGLTVTPPTAHVEINLLMAWASRTLLVNPQIAGRPPYPYRVVDIIPSPDKITVYGRPEELRLLTSIPTAKIVLDGLKTNITQTVPLMLPPNTTVSKGKNTVEVTVVIRSKQG